ncbi:hypothetical protein [Nitrososphaera sp.]|uniref:hypothetical protein n=1 Tax=Nitrososphaera sp. TaxID=1971748 RepID=UPI002EDA4BE1
MSDVIIAAGITACVGAATIFTLLYIHYNSRRPALVVANSPQEPYFKARITVHNRNKTAYSYRIRVNKTYLKWQSDIVTGGDKTIATLPQDHGSGVILDDVLDELKEHEMVIEALNWRPRPWSKVVYKQKFENI